MLRLRVPVPLTTAPVAYVDRMTPPDLGPLIYVCAAPGGGKTTLMPALVAAADGEVIIDIDEVLEDGYLLGVPIAFPDAAPIWPAYDRMWRHITTMIRRAGHPVVELTQVPEPEDLQRAADRPGVHWLGWDCPDEVRIRRLQQRGWSTELIDGAVYDAEQCRRLLPALLTSSGTEPIADVAQAMLDRVRELSQQHRSGADDDR